MGIFYYNKDENEKLWNERKGEKTEDCQRETIINEVWHGIRIKIIRLPDNYVNYKPNLN